MDIRSKEELQADYVAETADAMERLKASLQLATSGLQYLTAVNGGAMIALFTLLGSGKVKFDMDGLWRAFGCFSAGIVFSLSAYLLGYLAQNQFYTTSLYRAWNAQAAMAQREPDPKHAPEKAHALGNKFLAAAILAAVFALTSFIAGAAVTFSSVA